MTLRPAVVVVALAGLAGCGQEVPTPGQSVDVTGTLTDAAGNPMKDVNVYFHPIGGTAQPASLKVGADGTFSGKVVAGEYSWVVAPPEPRAGAVQKETTVKGVPAAYLQPNLDRKVTVSSGAKLDLKVS